MAFTGYKLYEIFGKGCAEGKDTYSAELVVGIINLLDISKGGPGDAVKPVLVEANHAVTWSGREEVPLAGSARKSNSRCSTQRWLFQRGALY